MLTLNSIIAVRRMMDQTGGDYPSYHNDHINPPANLDNPSSNYQEHSIEVNLGYNSNGDLVQR